MGVSLWVQGLGYSHPEADRIRDLTIIYPKPYFVYLGGTIKVKTPTWQDQPHFLGTLVTP